MLGLTAGTAATGLTLLTPALPLIRDDLGASSDAVQLLITLYVFAMALGQLFAGTISDRIGRRPVLQGGSVLYTLAAGGATLAPSIEWLTLCRAFQGLGAAACLAMTRAIINDCFDRQGAARSMSSVQTVQAVVPMLSLAGGGALAQFAGWEGSMAVMSGAGLAALLLTLAYVGETNRRPAPSIDLVSVLQAYAGVLRNPVFLSFGATGSLIVGAFFALNGFLPYQYQRLGVSPLEFGLWFSLTPLSFFVGNALNRLYFVARGIERAAMIGCTLSLASVIAMYATQAAGLAHPLALALPCAGFGLANGIVVANVTIGAISAAGHQAGTGTGLIGAAQMTTGGLAGSLIIAFGGAEDFAFSAAIMTLMSALAVLSIVHVYRRRAELSGS